ncbi:hypothetical protein NBH00_25010 [Paraconexibacter antarcticus]|uniref:Uncharacterized protein n=1 Tax=Paraconexibacter antarcticus TaxID=2949664 RepID=A0ABY5DRC1_9ACTN|nr:hypothetical protein [Paraconexibacter antarcticus]UTI64580.1 hypothetical protein NBH00_25010 [Paraconexibacter antarcticus]
MSAPGAGADALAAVAATLQAEGGLVAEAVAPPPPGTVTPHGDAAAAGPRAARDPAAYVEIVEAVREGHLTHVADGVGGGSRIVTTTDADLALLVGDRLYALGLSRLADRGDLEAVAALADTIVLGAQAQATGDADLADAAWEAGAQAVGHGPSEALEAAKNQARAGDPSASSALRAAARQLGRLGTQAP